MKTNPYVKTLLIISFVYFMISLIFIIIYTTLNPSQSLLLIVIIFIIAYLCLFCSLALLYVDYYPIVNEAHKSANLNRILYELLQKTVQVNNRDELYQVVLESAIKALPSAQKGCILLLNHTNSELSFVAAHGYDFDILKDTYLRLDQTYLYRESKGKIKHTVMIHDPFGYDKEHLHDDNIDNILSAGVEAVMTTLSTPVIFNNTLHGMINIDSRYVNAFTQADKNIIELFALEIANVLTLFTSMEKVNYFLNHDILTGVYNRKFFNEALTNNLENAHNNSIHFSVISIDLNNLKITNDTYGHECGDKLLIEFSGGISANIPSTAIFSRYGGDEFTLLLPNFDKEQSELLMNAIKGYFILHAFEYDDTQLPISFCYGIVSFPHDKQSFDALLMLADERMYEQKRHYHDIHFS